MIAAAFLSYSGPFLSNYRDELVEKTWLAQVYYLVQGCGDGAVVRALASHQSGSSLIPGLGVILCVLSLLLVLVDIPRGFLMVLRFFPLVKTNISLSLRFAS